MFYYALNEFFLSRFDIKCFQTLCQLLRFPQFFLFRVISKQLLYHLRRPFSAVCETLSSTIFSLSCPSMKQTWKSCFCFFTDDKQYKANLTRLPLEIMHRGHTWHDYPWPWVSLTWLLYNLQLDDVPGASTASQKYQ